MSAPFVPTDAEDLRGAIRCLLKLHPIETVLKAIAHEAGMVEMRPYIQRDGRGERTN